MEWLLTTCLILTLFLLYFVANLWLTNQQLKAKVRFAENRSEINRNLFLRTKIAVEELEEMYYEIKRQKTVKEVIYKTSNAPIPEEKLKRLKMLCHPDKHNGSKMANDVSAWLNRL